MRWPGGKPTGFRAKPKWQPWPNTHYGPVRVGVSGCDYDDWQGIVYPKPAPRGFDRMAYVAKFVDLIEINATFYRIPPLEVVDSWIRRTPRSPQFHFAVKAWKGFTHVRDDSTFARDMTQFEPVLMRLKAAKKLLATLIQFPHSFARTPVNRRYLARLLDALQPYYPVVEFRHISWYQRPVITELRRRRAGFVALDMPASKTGIGPDITVATGGPGYFRFHGRNEHDWFRSGAGKLERYLYPYDAATLAGTVRRLNTLHDDSLHVGVAFNNHPQGHAMANALMYKALLRQTRVDVPPTLQAAYPVLEQFSSHVDLGIDDCIVR